MSDVRSNLGGWNVLDSSKYSTRGLTRFQGGDDEGTVIPANVDQGELSLLHREGEHEAAVLLLFGHQMSARLSSCVRTACLTLRGVIRLEKFSM